MSTGRAPSPAPSIDPLGFEETHSPSGHSASPASASSRPESWLSASSALSSPGIDGRIFDQFPSVPGGSDTRFGNDGTLLTPPGRSSSLLSNPLKSKRR